MKLCPQCEFIYEDNQRCCDMDGMELVYEPTLDRVLDKPVESNSRPSGMSPRLRRVVQVLLVTLVFSAAFSIFYFGYARRSPSIIPPASASNSAAPEPAPSNSPLPLPADDAIAIPPAETEADNANSQSEITKPVDKPGGDANHSSLPSKGRNAASTKAAPALSVTAMPRVKPLPRLKPLPKLEENRKKDSRVGSFLKKTGRILTKPFKR